MGPFSSQVRIYLSPTLTQQMGMAICFGPQQIGAKMKLPFSALGGNCIVTKVSPPKSACEQSNVGEEDLSDQDILDLAEFGQCTQTQRQGGRSTPPVGTPRSPFKMVGISAQGKVSDPFPAGTYFGIINFEKRPFVEGDAFFDDGVVLK